MATLDELFFGKYSEEDNDPVCFEKIENLIKVYQKKFHTFKESVNIYERICFHMTQVYNDSLLSLYRNDPYTFVLLISTFFGQQSCLVEEGDDNYLVIVKAKYPLHTYLLLCYAARTMECCMIREKDEAKAEKFEKLGEKWEKSAINILDKLYENDPEQAINALQIDYRRKLRKIPGTIRNTGCCKTCSEYLNNKHNQSRELMSIAYYAKAMHFLSQTACREVINKRADSRKQWIKYIINVSFRAIHLFLLAVLLVCGNPLHKMETRLSRDILRWFWAYIILVLISQFTTTVLKLIDKLCIHHREMSHDKLNNTKKNFAFVHRYLNQNKLSIFRMITYISILSFEMMRFTIFTKTRGGVPNGESGFSDIFVPLVSDLLYCFLFAVSAITSLRYFQTRSVGFFLHILQKMFKTVRMFSLIFLLFWMILAIVCTRLTNKLGESNNSIRGYSNNSWLFDLQKMGKFEIFGEIDDAEKTGISDECKHYENHPFSPFNKMDFHEASCFVRSIFIPYLFFAYMFISGILLINLLTAQLTKEYEELCEKSKYYKDYIKYEYTSKLESKMWLPAPISIIYVMLRCVCFAGVYRILERLEGIEFGSNHFHEIDEEDIKLVCENARDIVACDNDRIWDELNKKITELSGKYPVFLEHLSTIKGEINSVLTQYEDEMRAGTRLAHSPFPQNHIRNRGRTLTQVDTNQLPNNSPSGVRRSTYYSASSRSLSKYSDSSSVAESVFLTSDIMTTKIDE